MIRPIEPVRLSYFGDRTYIDISTTSASFFRACGIDPSDRRLGAEAIRILEPLRRQGHLLSEEVRAPAATFAFEFNKEKHSFSFVESDETIVERRPEPVYRIEDHVRIDGTTATFVRPLTEVMTYNLMVMGKALLVSASHQTPRVVRTFLRFNLVRADYAVLAMELSHLKNDFVLLRTRLHERPHGEIFVKIGSPKER